KNLNRRERRVPRVFKNFLIFIRDIINSRQMIWQMTVSDFKATYLGSYLGIVWAFIQPMPDFPCSAWVYLQTLPTTSPS
ncbi:MAG: hypothetical protein WCI71_14755, partial [Bacteroidota bacterium]